MATITLKGQPIHTSGTLPAVGTRVPDFVLTKNDLSDVSLKDFAGKKKLLNIVTSIDTGVCASSTRRFNQEAAQISGAVLCTISSDLPFAQKRFCDSEGISKVLTLSELRTRRFGDDYGVRIVDGPLAGLLARAIVVVDEEDKVVYTELVSEHSHEPDYAKALAALKA